MIAMEDEVKVLLVRDGDKQIENIIGLFSNDREGNEILKRQVLDLKRICPGKDICVWTFQLNIPNA